MKPLIALGISFWILAIADTWLGLTLNLLVWATFIAWASFYAAGGDGNALKTSLICNVFGVIVAWVAAMLILELPVLGLVPRASIVVGTFTAVLVFAAHIKTLSAIPSSVFGFASFFAYILQTKDAMSLESLVAPNMKNGLILVVVSMIVGNIFGIASAKLSAALQPKPGAAKTSAAA